MTDRQSPVALVDRAWTGLWTAMMVTDVQVPPLDVARAVVRDVMVARSGTPYGATLDARRAKWVPVPPHAVEAHLDRVVVAVEDPEPEAVDALLGELTRRHPDDLPFRVWVGRHTVAYTGTHMLGDAATDAVLIRAVVDGDASAVLRMPRVDATTLRRALVAQTRLHHREWAQLAARRLGTRPAHPVASPAVPDGLGGGRLRAVGSDPARGRAAEGPSLPVGTAPGGTGIVSAVLSNAQMRELSRWRNARAKGASITAVMASLMARSLMESGVAVDTSGFYTLIDLRRYLVGQPAGGEAATPEPVMTGGNLAKALRLACDLTDPRAVDAALSELVTSGRPMAATVLGAGLSALSRPAAAAPAAPPAVTDEPLVLTYNSIHGLPGTFALPWTGDTPGRYLGTGFPVGGAGLSIVAHRMREHMEMAASVAPGTVDPSLVRHVLGGLSSFAAADLARP